MCCFFFVCPYYFLSFFFSSVACFTIVYLLVMNLAHSDNDEKTKVLKIKKIFKFAHFLRQMIKRNNLYAWFLFCPGLCFWVFSCPKYSLLAFHFSFRSVPANTIELGHSNVRQKYLFKHCSYSSNHEICSSNHVKLNLPRMSFSLEKFGRLRVSTDFEFVSTSRWFTRVFFELYFRW